MRNVFGLNDREKLVFERRIIYKYILITQHLIKAAKTNEDINQRIMEIFRSAIK